MEFWFPPSICEVGVIKNRNHDYLDKLHQHRFNLMVISSTNLKFYKYKIKRPLYILDNVDGEKRSPLNNVKTCLKCYFICLTV